MRQSPPASPLYGYPTDLAGSWLLIHGYHTTVGGAEASYGVIEAALPSLVFLGDLWPGGNIAADFPLAVIRAREAGWRLADVLCGQPAATSRTIHVQTHSLGARVILTVLASGAVELGNVILSAPAVDCDCLDAGGEFADAPLHCRSLTVAFSRNDPVLRVDYPLGSFGHRALGWQGPSSYGKLAANVRTADFSRIVLAHSAYRSCPEYIGMWQQIASGDVSATPTHTVL